jgi:hypothetical protein
MGTTHGFSSLTLAPKAKERAAHRCSLISPVRRTIRLDQKDHAEFRRHSAVSAFSRHNYYCEQASILDAFTVFDVPEPDSKPPFRLTTSWLTQ